MWIVTTCKEGTLLFKMNKLFSAYLLLEVCILSVDSSIKPPPYLKLCSLSDPNLDECCLRHGKEALPILVKGDRKYNIPKLSPLFLPELAMDASHSLHVTMKDIYAFGLERADLKKVKFDIKNKKVSLKLNIDNLQIIGKYDINGKILILPIQGKGDVNITAIDGEYQYDLEYSLQRKGDEDHVVVKDNDKLNFELEDLKIKLDNLFNGDKLLGKHVNEFINEHWRDVLSELGKTISETVRSVARAIITGYFSRISYDQLFLK